MPILYEIEGDILDVSPEGGVGELEYYEIEGDILDVSPEGGVGELEYYEIEGDILDVSPEPFVRIVQENDVLQPIGEGTEQNPYLIRYFGNLRWVSENTASLDKYFTQVRSIDAVYSEQLDDGAGFTPIGNATTKFTGFYDGGGYAISNLYINRPTEDYIGLFGYISTANAVAVRELLLSSVNITGKSFVGGLAGYLYNASTSTINDCYSTGVVSSLTGSVGGIVGAINKGIFNRCYSLCAISGVSYCGGFVGQDASTGIYNDCYSIGNVSGVGAVGGFAGIFSNASKSNRCYCVGIVTGTSQVGGFVGEYTVFTTPASGCYYDSTISGRSDTHGGSAPKTITEMKMPDTFEDWNFTTIWALNIAINIGYPYLLTSGMSQEAVSVNYSKRQNQLARKMKRIDSTIMNLYGKFIIRRYSTLSKDILTTPDGQYYGVLLVMQRDTVIDRYTDLTLDDGGTDLIGVELPIGPITGIFTRISISTGCIICSKLPESSRLYEDDIST